MSGSTDVVKDFVTPDRAPHQSSADHSIEEKKDVSTGESVTDTLKADKPKATTVTPPESASREEAKKDVDDSPLQMVASRVESPEDRHVRFDKRMERKTNSPVDSPSSTTSSQRGLVSRRGGRCASPGRIGTTPNNPHTEKALEEKSSAEAPKVKEDDSGSSSSTSDKKQAGPLSARESDTVKVKADGSRSETAPARRSNVSFSPVPPMRESAVGRPIRTPTKSPTAGRFQSLPTLDDGAIRSPVGLFLSPHPPTSRSLLGRSDSFDNTEADAGSKKQPADSKLPMRSPTRSPMRSPKTPRSPRTPRREDRDRFMATPTDFAMDYGKHSNSGSFDNSNVLAWLQSPTANGLFSPGGFGSMLNTPRGAGPRTPRTPTVSTSFFFSDVAGLPRSGDASPKPGGDAGKRGNSQRGYSNIICISPLASSKSKNGTHQQSYTPTMNYKDMFASPAERLKARGVSRTASRDPSLDAVHMAERDLMEDEDLSVLLQLASNTPRSTGDRPVAVSTSDGTQVFRSSPRRSNGQSSDENLPSLQLPIIGGRESEGNGTRLSRKTHSRDHGDANDEQFHRPMGIRSNSGIAKDDHHGKAKKGNDKADDKRKDSSRGEGSKVPVKTTSLHPPPPAYSMPPHPYAHPDNPYYTPMPPGMPPHGGSMRVVVGGPPPSRSKASPSHSPPRGYPMGPGDPNYPPPPYPPPGRYPHHPGVPPPHMHPHYSHYPPPHHPPPPPPRHMPMYGAQHPPANSKPLKKSSKPAKSGAKRPVPAPTPKPSSAKKQKKASPASIPKKKNRSPQITDKIERQKAAAKIAAVNAASGGKNDKAAALAAAILRGVTMRPSGKWQAQLYFAGKSRYIGVFDTREKAALAYEIAREKLKTEKASVEGGALSPKQTEAAVNAARKAAFEGVNERDPRLASK